MTAENEPVDAEGIDGSPEANGIRPRLRGILAARPPVTESLAHLGPFILASTGTFLAFSAVGYLVSPAVAEGVALCEGSIAASDTTLGYFLNNAGTAFTMMGGLGVLTLYALARNGVALGAALGIPLLKGMAPAALAVRIVPHGVVEIPALWIAGAIGLFLPWRVGTYLLGRRDRIATREDERHLLQLFLVVLGLILLAGFVEAQVTARLAAAVPDPTCSG